MDKVFIKELCIETVIGVYDWERKIKQAVCIDLELGTQRPNGRSPSVMDRKTRLAALVGRLWRKAPNEFWLSSIKIQAGKSR